MTDITLDDLAEQLRAEQETNLLLQESIADHELALEDRGWARIEAMAGTEFSPEGLRRAARVGRVMTVAHPLIRRGVTLRTAYVWGQGVHIEARANGSEDGQQDVNGVVQDFLDDELNRAALTSGQARERHERTLGTDGNIMLALFTQPMTGRVQARTVPWEEVVDVVCNPDDKSEPWFYLRRWTSTTVNPFTGHRELVNTEVYYPALGFRPRVRPKMVDDVEVWWDAPMVHVAVNALEGWTYGIGDTYTAIAWARMYQEFLTDWAKLVKALSQFAWRLTGDKSAKARKAAAALRARQPDTVTDSEAKPGATFASGPGAMLEAIPKSGATIDSDSGRPLATMIAAGLGVPVTMLLCDPGATGARAVAETLDLPTELEMGMRRTMWGDVYRRILGYVVDQAVRAPGGPLRGTVVWDRDADREVISLAGDTDRTIEIEWPDLSDTPVETLVKAIVEADSTEKLPPLVVARLLLQALGVKDVDELVEQLTGEDGEFVPPTMTAGQAAIDRFRRGEPPIEGDPGDDSEE